ncbi:MULTISPECIES: discoidin domain-containing protein [unclassified Streptomyces]|uniref:discoidin domain-containing protein n=1 Tax=unclassified Streptomyces TaxID=2593676 RepID=UPI00226D7DD1|nr:MULTISPECIES: discoidin domain-containing protein [unclassified Streptomyces]MCY0920460.1 discoidin domain-containing protein [Streptomyces sp. H27-G5]MCY0961769.1 discoidin domain-containing protein [Streptomyces sp. H27-H5]
MRRLNWRSRVLAALLSTALMMITWPALTAAAAGGPSIAAGRPAAASSTNGSYTAANVTDGNQPTYWESAGGTFPQWVQTDLGATTRIDQVVLKLPAAWESRSQTLSVQGSADGTGFANRTR